jgi:hypothetical protein
MLKLLLKAFSDIKDFRDLGRCLYSQASVLAIALIGVGAECFGWVDIHNYAVCQRDLVTSILHDLPGVPSHDTLARIASKMDVVRLSEAVDKLSNEFLTIATPRGPGRPPGDAAPEVIAIDGKTLRGSGKANERRAIHIVNVLCRGMIISCVRVPEMDPP